MPPVHGDTTVPAEPTAGDSVAGRDRVPTLRPTARCSGVFAPLEGAHAFE